MPSNNKTKMLQDEINLQMKLTRFFANIVDNDIDYAYETFKQMKMPLSIFLSHYRLYLDDAYDKNRIRAYEYYEHAVQWLLYKEENKEKDKEHA